MSADAQLQMTNATMDVLDSWGLNNDEMRELLALPSNARARAYNHYRQNTPFPDDPQVLKRAGYILRIADALRTTFPTNPNMAGRWIRQAHRRFGQQSPLSVMLQDETGLVAILAQLDCTFAWDQSGSKAS